MARYDRKEIEALLRRHHDLGIAEQIDYQKFYLYSIIAHSTAIEGSTVTEVEAQLLFDEGITSNKRTIIEQQMNLDLKSAYEYGMTWIMHHEDISVAWLCDLAAHVMEHTGNEYHTAAGDFNAARGELRRINVTAGVGGRSYLSFQKVPERLEVFCTELNRQRRDIKPNDIIAAYEMSFWAHYRLVTIHPWADGNGRMSRLLMNLLQIENGMLPSKVLSSDKAEYIQALIDSRDQDEPTIFIDTMMKIHAEHLQADIASFINSTDGNASDTSHLPSDRRAVIIDYLRRHGESRAVDIAAALRLSPQRTRHYLNLMVAEGTIIALGANKNRTYLITESK